MNARALAAGTHFSKSLHETDRREVFVCIYGKWGAPMSSLGTHATYGSQNVRFLMSSPGKPKMYVNH